MKGAIEALAPCAHPCAGPSRRNVLHMRYAAANCKLLGRVGGEKQEGEVALPPRPPLRTSP